MTATDRHFGYLSDTTYPDRFHRELSPTWLNYVAVSGGAPPRRLAEPFTYLDLGCGFAHSTVVNAGAFARAEFHACDFNPVHIEAATRRAARLGLSNIRFHEAYFEDLLQRDLPAFDFIVLHGIYSWVAPEVRQIIGQIIAKKLKPGGLVYVSYNCLPGWSADSPLRRLMLELAARESGDVERRATSALAELNRLSKANFSYFRDNPGAVTTLATLGNDPANYLAHEFLNATWALYYSIDVAHDLALAGATYLGSATLKENHPALLIDAAAAAAIAKLGTPRLQQLALDFAVNQRFRRDVFVKGGPPVIHPAAQLRNLDDVIIGCVTEVEQIGPQIVVPRGKLTFQDAFIGELRSVMSHGSMRLGDVMTQLGGDGRDAAAMRQNLSFLIAAGTLMPFARAGSYGQGPARVASAVVRNSLADIIETKTAGVVPCEWLGNGVVITLDEATQALAWLSGRGPANALPTRLARLGLLTSGGAAD
jgi:SAM-dependent methyltransferase